MPVELLGEAPRRAVAVYAHPDDSDVSCGGTLARWADAGTTVDLIVCAAGDKGTRDAATQVGSLVAVRAAEVEAAARVLGLSGVHRLGRPDGEFENDADLRRELVLLLRELRPEVLICPDPLAVFFGEHYYNHRDHRVVGYAALDAAAPAAASPCTSPTPDHLTPSTSPFCRALSSRTSTSRSRRPSAARQTRSVVTSASLVTPGNRSVP